ncbi:MAG: acylphosphatase [Patescibacteria group bacterium]|nr:acylphosphatase [Patescibacteria group bacterium]
MIKHLEIKVVGQVVGVNFRASAKQQAEALGLGGFAKNVSANEVYIEVEGEDAAVAEFVNWCRAGNLWSKVEALKIQEGPLKNLMEFKILRGDYES